jgi:hypothetical protein
VLAVTASQDRHEISCFPGPLGSCHSTSHVKHNRVTCIRALRKHWRSESCLHEISHNFPRFAPHHTQLFQHFSPVTCTEGRSWRAERSWSDEKFSAHSGESIRDGSPTGAIDLEHTLECHIATDLHNGLNSICMHVK